MIVFSYNRYRAVILTSWVRWMSDGECESEDPLRKYRPAITIVRLKLVAIEVDCYSLAFFNPDIDSAGGVISKIAARSCRHPCLLHWLDTLWLSDRPSERRR